MIRLGVVGSSVDGELGRLRVFDMVSLNEVLFDPGGQDLGEECVYRLEVSKIKAGWSMMTSRLVLFTLSITTQHEIIFINPIMSIPLDYY